MEPMHVDIFNYYDFPSHGSYKFLSCVRCEVYCVFDQILSSNMNEKIPLLREIVICDLFCRNMSGILFPGQQVLFYVFQQRRQKNNVSLLVFATILSPGSSGIFRTTSLLIFSLICKKICHSICTIHTCISS